MISLPDYIFSRILHPFVLWTKIQAMVNRRMSNEVDGVRSRDFVLVFCANSRGENSLPGGAENFTFIDFAGEIRTVRVIVYHWAN